MEPVTRFESHCCPEPNTGCWLWTGGLNRQGYGKFHFGKTMFAHRASWLLHRGSLDESQHVLHQCDTPGCVNPEHLFLGSHLQNMRDKAAKGRQHRPSGQSNGNAKITNEQAVEIRRLRAEGASAQVLAARFGLSQPSMSDLLRGKTYV